MAVNLVKCCFVLIGFVVVFAVKGPVTPVASGKSPQVSGYPEKSSPQPFAPDGAEDFGILDGALVIEEDSDTALKSREQEFNRLYDRCSPSRECDKLLEEVALFHNDDGCIVLYVPQLPKIEYKVLVSYPPSSDVEECVAFLNPNERKGEKGKMYPIETGLPFINGATVSIRGFIRESMTRTTEPSVRNLYVSNALM